MIQNRKQKLPGRPLADGDVEALIKACGHGPSGLRNRALIAVMAGSGVRVSEALDLVPGDIEEASPGEWRLHVQHGKGDKARWTFLRPVGAVLLSEWLRERDRLGLSGRTRLFCTISLNSKGKRMSDAYVRQLLPRLAAKAGIPRRVHAHALRHTFATKLRREGVDIAVISDALGHESIATTARYLRRIAPEHVAKAIWSQEGW